MKNKNRGVLSAGAQYIFKPLFAHGRLITTYCRYFANCFDLINGHEVFHFPTQFYKFYKSFHKLKQTKSVLRAPYNTNPLNNVQSIVNMQ